MDLFLFFLNIQRENVKPLTIDFTIDFILCKLFAFCSLKYLEE